MTPMRRIEIGNELLGMEDSRAKDEVIDELRITLLYGHLMREKLLKVAKSLSTRDAASILSVVAGTSLPVARQTLNNLLRQELKAEK